MREECPWQNPILYENGGYKDPEDPQDDLSLICELNPFLEEDDARFDDPEDLDPDGCDDKRRRVRRDGSVPYSASW